MRRTAMLLLLAALLVGCGKGDTDPVPAADRWTGPELNQREMGGEEAIALDEVASAEVSAAGVPGMWVGIWDPDAGRHVGAYGKSVVAPKRAATTRDHGRIGALEDTFTGTARLEGGGVTVEDLVDQADLSGTGTGDLPDPFSHGYDGATDVTGASTGMYATIDDLGTWAGTAFGTTLVARAAGERRLRRPEGSGLQRYGGDWVGRTGETDGWAAIAVFNTRTGAAGAAIVNDGAGLQAAERVVRHAFPDLQGL